jgi:hypothetical protein
VVPPLDDASPGRSPVLVAPPLDDVSPSPRVDAEPVPLVSLPAEPRPASASSASLDSLLGAYACVADSAGEPHAALASATTTTTRCTPRR